MEGGAGFVAGGAGFVAGGGVEDDVAVVDARTPEPAGGEEALTDRLEGRFRYGWVFAMVWLVFLAQPMTVALDDENRWRGGLGIAAVGAFGVLFVVSWRPLRIARNAGRPLPRRYRIRLLTVMTLLALVACITSGQAGLGTAPFLVVVIMMIMPARLAVRGVGALVAVVLGATVVVPGWELTEDLATGLILTAFIMFGMSRVIQRNVDLRLQAELAVAQERARFARDLHDVLGHSLTLLAMKAELAGRLVHADPQRAEAEIADVERLARDALTDVRAAVGGYRPTTLAGELVAARVALDAAGIEAELPAAVDEVPGERRELFGWVLREGVTNVIRHSRARHCRVVVDRDGIEILDDGRGPHAATGPGGHAGTGGHGLAGLRERAENAGAGLTVGANPGGGFRLRVGW